MLLSRLVEPPWAGVDWETCWVLLDEDARGTALTRRGELTPSLVVGAVVVVEGAAEVDVPGARR